MGKLELYIPVGRERLRCGYTTIKHYNHWWFSFPELIQWYE